MNNPQKSKSELEAALRYLADAADDVVGLAEAGNKTDWDNAHVEVSALLDALIKAKAVLERLPS